MSQYERDQPVVRENVDLLRISACNRDKMVPRNLFVAFREIPPENLMHPRVI